MAHIWPSERFRVGVRPDPARGNRIAIPRTEPDGNTACCTERAPARIGELLVVLAPSEPHRDVAVRTQILAQDAAVSRAVLLAADPPKWHRYVPTMPVLRSRLSALATKLSARVLRASFPREAVRVEAWTRAADVLRHAAASDLVVVGRRPSSPWPLAPLARHVRRLLRRTRTPLLVVGRRPAGPYRNVVIAADRATDLDAALDWARRIAPQGSFTLLHVETGHTERALPGAPARKDILMRRVAALRNAAARLKDLLVRHRCVDGAVLVHGSPIHDAARKARELGADLVVVVKTTHSWWADLLGASVSTAIAARADCDVLVIHGKSSHRFGMPA